MCRPQNWGQIFSLTLNELNISAVQMLSAASLPSNWMANQETGRARYGWSPQCFYTPAPAAKVGLSSPPKEQIGRRFIRGDIVLWVRWVWVFHYPSITSEVWRINCEAATSSYTAERPTSLMKLKTPPWPFQQSTQPTLTIHEPDHVSVHRNSYQHYHLLLVLWVCQQNRTNKWFVSRAAMKTHLSSTRAERKSEAIPTPHGWPLLCLDHSCLYSAQL